MFPAAAAATAAPHFSSVFNLAIQRLLKHQSAAVRRPLKINVRSGGSPPSSSSATEVASSSSFSLIQTNATPVSSNCRIYLQFVAAHKKKKQAKPNEATNSAPCICKKRRAPLRPEPPPTGQPRITYLVSHSAKSCRQKVYSRECKPRKKNRAGRWCWLTMKCDTEILTTNDHGSATLDG